MCTYAPWGVRADERTKSRKRPTWKNCRSFSNRRAPWYLPGGGLPDVSFAQTCCPSIAPTKSSCPSIAQTCCLFRARAHTLALRPCNVVQYRAAGGGCEHTQQCPKGVVGVPPALGAAASAARGSQQKAAAPSPCSHALTCCHACGGLWFAVWFGWCTADTCCRTTRVTGPRGVGSPSSTPSACRPTTRPASSGSTTTAVSHRVAAASSAVARGRIARVFCGGAAMWQQNGAPATTIR